MRRSRHGFALVERLVVVAIVLLLRADSGLSADADPTPGPTAGAQYLGVTGGTMDAKAFAAALESCGKIRVRPVARKGDWKAAAPGHAALITCGFGRGAEGKGQAEAFIFEFGQDGMLLRAAHVPYGMSFIWNAQSWRWVPPAGGLAAAYLEARLEKDPAQRTPLKLVLAEWSDDGEKPQGEEAQTDDMPRLDKVSALPWSKAAPAVEAMCWWAAWDNGWRPGAKDARVTARVEVRMKFQAMDIKLRLTAAGADKTIVKRDVPEMRCQKFLVRLFMLAAGKAGVRDFGLLDEKVAKLLIADRKGVVYATPDGLRRVSALTGKLTSDRGETKDDKKKRRAGPPFAVRGQSVFSFARGVIRVDAATGREEPLAGPAAGPWAFSLVGKTGAATACREEVSMFTNGKAVWTTPARTTLTCGPLVSDKAVFCGDAEGVLYAFRRSDGKKIWTQALPAPIRGSLALCGKPPRLYGCDRQVLYALDVKDGKLLWKQDVGDTLRVPPFLCAGAVLAATRSNRLLLLDAADGKIRHERSWNAWLTEVRGCRIRGQELLVATDNTGVVSVLAPDGLQSLATFSPSRTLMPELLVHNAFPLRWGEVEADDAEATLTEKIDDVEVRRGPTVMAADQQGFIYLMELPAPEAKP